MSIHAVALVAVLLRQQRISDQAPVPFDLDSIGAWAILGAVGTAMPMLLGWAPALKKSKARPLVRVWGIMTIIGAVCAYAAMVRAKSFGFDANTTQSRQTCQRALPTPMRKQEEPVSLSFDILFAPPYNNIIKAWDIAALVMMAFGAWSCLRLGTVGQSAMTAVGINGLNPTQHHPDSRKKVFAVIAEQGLIVASMLFFWGLVAINERFFFQQAVLEVEGRDSFEQWSCWAATGLVVAAAVLNWTLERIHQNRYLPSQPFAPEALISSTEPESLAGQSNTTKWHVIG